MVLGLFGGVGYLGGWLGDDIVTRLTAGITSFAEQYLLEGVVTATILPTVHEVLKTGRADLISVGFVLSIWSGSRALNVFVDTISIMYGQSGVRGIVRTRVLSLTLKRPDKLTSRANTCRSAAVSAAELAWNTLPPESAITVHAFPV